MINALATAVLRMAAEEEQSERDKERDAFSVSATIGGTPRVWTEYELLVEDAGPGLHFDYTHRGRVLEVRYGNPDFRELSKWIQTFASANRLKLRVDPRELDDRDGFSNTLCNLLKQLGVECSSRGGQAVHIGGFHNVFAATKRLLGENGVQKVAAYFDIPISRKKRRM